MLSGAYIVKDVGMNIHGEVDENENSWSCVHIPSI